MALINPVHGLVVPFLCLFTLPLAIFAGFTTALAFSVLMFRVAIVYIEMALSTIPEYLLGWSKPRVSSTSILYHRQPRSSRASWGSTGAISPTSSVSSQSGYSTPSPIASFAITTGGAQLPSNLGQRRKSSYGLGSVPRNSRRSSQVSLASLGAKTPKGCVTPAVESGIAPSAGIDRDFEGVGGWRLEDKDDDGGEWTSINSRLELPLERPSLTLTTRHHHRSLSAGPTSPGEAAWLMMKTKTSRDSKVGEFTNPGNDVSFNPTSTTPNSRDWRPSQNLDSALTPGDQDKNGYFPLHISPKSRRKPSFST